MASKGKSVKDAKICHIVDILRHNKEHQNSCALLIGAGCSVSAGIPDASGIVARIAKEYPSAYADAEPKDYATCMETLPQAHRQKLICDIIAESKNVNWAHIAIAQMMAAGFTDRILTVNFDPLLQMACAMVRLFPAYYDFAAKHEYAADHVAKQAVFYLHGQHTGFSIRNTRLEVATRKNATKQIISDTGQNRTWIVVGYSGKNDPVFEALEKLPRFSHALYWVGYGKDDPPPHLRKILSKQDAYFVRGYDADTFFVELTRKLKCFPPKFVGQPYSHLKDMLDTLTDFPAAGGQIDLLEYAKGNIAEAAQRNAPGFMAAALLAEGNGDALRQLYKDTKGNDNEVNNFYAWSYIGEGNALSNLAKEKTGETADMLFAQAYEKYAAARTIKPDHHDAFNNWGLTLSVQAKGKNGEQADTMFALAYKKYAAALAIKPDMHEALLNWGAALADQAQKKTGAQADTLYAQAAEKYAAALKIKPDMHEALLNWGTALANQAQKKTGAQADTLYALAAEKYAAALKIKPDSHDVLSNWGLTLADQAPKKTGAQADTLYALAAEKFSAALAIKPDMHAALYNWGLALANQAKGKDGTEADRLFAQAYEKYAAALAIKPDMHEALNNWGTALANQAQKKTGAQAETLFAQAAEKYAAALKIKPDKHEALNNWGLALANQAEGKDGTEADRLYALAYEKYAAALTIKPEYYEALYNWGAGLLIQADHCAGEEQQALLQTAKDKIERAYALDPAAAAYNMACLSARLGDHEAALKYLREARDGGRLPPSTHLLVDPDLAGLRDTAEFKAFLEKTFGKADGA
jgi:tetratricopeptide (TPR) repeat protein